MAEASSSTLSTCLSCRLLIVGAGPYGLALAAMARHLGLDFLIVGKPFEFWRRHTPKRMLLRSGLDWHIDPLESATLRQYLSGRAEDPTTTEPLTESLSREVFLDYLEWFVERKGIEMLPLMVQDLDLDRTGDGFLATLEEGTKVAAERVVAVPGFASFPSRPEDLLELFPAGRISHTCESVELAAFRDRTCLVVGGRQSAFEWAALMAENGARAVHLTYRHPTPDFAPSDWSWVEPLLARTLEDPRWFRELSPEDRSRLENRFWSEGRRKLEPWLLPRIQRPEITLHPGTRIADCALRDRHLRVELDSGARLTVDHVLLATGYRVDLRRLGFLGSLLGRIELDEGYPRLDEGFQSSIPGLFFAGLTTTKAFGPFFGFLVGAPTTARRICQGLGFDPDHPIPSQQSEVSRA